MNADRKRDGIDAAERVAGEISIIRHMAELHMTEREVVRDFAAVMEKIRQGAEIIVERDAQPVAVIKAAQFGGRSIDDCIALAKAHGSHATLDEGFSKDLEELIESRRQPPQGNSGSGAAP